MTKLKMVATKNTNTVHLRDSKYFKVPVEGKELEVDAATFERYNEAYRKWREVQEELLKLWNSNPS